jgi:hypothetical protein
MMIPISVILPMLRKAAPYLLIVAALGAVWFHGRHSGVESERGKTLAAIVERDEARTAAENNYRQWEQSEAARARQSEAIRDMEQATADADARVRAAHRAEVERLAREHARVLADAQRRADALAERVRDLSVAETCHEAWLEVVR